MLNTYQKIEFEIRTVSTLVSPQQWRLSLYSGISEVSQIWHGGRGKLCTIKLFDMTNEWSIFSAPKLCYFVEIYHKHQNYVTNFAFKRHYTFHNITNKVASSWKKLRHTLQWAMLPIGSLRQLTNSRWLSLGWHEYLILMLWYFKSEGNPL